MRMEDYTKAFPGRVNIDQYKPIIEAALKAAKGQDGQYRVVVEDYGSAKEATKAANAIRNHCKANKLELRVSCPEEGNLIRVYRSENPRKPRTRKKASAPSVPADSGEADSSDQA